MANHEETFENTANKDSSDNRNIDVAPLTLLNELKQVVSNQQNDNSLSCLPQLNICFEPGRPHQGGAPLPAEIEALQNILKRPAGPVESAPSPVEIESLRNTPLEPFEKLNNLEKMAAEAIIKDKNLNLLSMMILMGADPKKTVDAVNKELEKAGSQLRVKADWSNTLVCGDPRTQGSYARLDLRLVGPDGKTIHSTTPIDEMKNGRGRGVWGSSENRQEILRAFEVPNRPILLPERNGRP